MRGGLDPASRRPCGHDRGPDEYVAKGVIGLVTGGARYAALYFAAALAATIAAAVVWFLVTPLIAPMLQADTAFGASLAPRMIG